jgi:hypothetical protein
MPEQSND